MSHVPTLLRTVVSNGLPKKATSGLVIATSFSKLGGQSRGFHVNSTTTTLSSSSSSSSTILVGIASSLLVGVANNNNRLSSRYSLCEGGDNFFDTITKKDKDGNTDWAGTAKQVTENDFWDKIASAAGEKIQGAYDTGIPSQLSYGFVCGFCSGYALKVVGRGAAVVFGLGFMGLQTLSYYGYVKVDHSKLKSDFEKALDLNQDGKVDGEDAKIVTNKVMEVLQYSMPAGGGFGGGFLAGIRSK